MIDNDQINAAERYLYNRNNFISTIKYNYKNTLNYLLDKIKKDNKNEIYSRTTNK